MLNNKFFILILFALLFSAGLSPAAPSRVNADAVDSAPKALATLVSEFETVALKQKSFLGLHLVMQPEWHTYWLNPGDSGLPTKIKWQDVPEGIELGDIQWPIPIVFVVGDQVNYGYSDEVTLLIPFTISKRAITRPPILELKGIASWLSCREACIREQQPVIARISVGQVDDSALLQGHALIRESLQQLPDKMPDEIQRSFKISWNSAHTLDFYIPDTLFKNSPGKDIASILVLSNDEGILQPTPPRVPTRKPRGYLVSLAISDYLTMPPKKLSGVVVLYFSDGTHQGFSFNNIELMEHKNG